MAILSAYHTYIPPPKVAKGIQWGLEARRATIFFRRAGQGQLIGAGAPNTRKQPELDAERNRIATKSGDSALRDFAPNTDIHSKFFSNGGLVDKTIYSLEDYVAIIDLEAGGENEGTEVIRLPFIPKELEYNSASAFATIKPLGRNNPNYHFTGAEDKLEFEIDWHAFDWGRREVIEKCRKIESLSKADGYNFRPHRVGLMWGRDDVLFNNMEFIVLAAPYKLTQFNKGNLDSQGRAVSTHMLPIQAYQQVTLGRITSNNLSKIDIEYVAATA